MSLQIGIVGLPNVGKSTLFSAVTKKQVDCANYPFCTIDPNVGVVEVPDERLKRLAEFDKSAKVVPTVIEFVDIAGLVKGASEGQGLGNKFLAHIRETDAIAQVVRAFDDSNILHVDGSVNPKRDADTINTELAIADLDSVSKRLQNAARAFAPPRVLARGLPAEEGPEANRAWIIANRSHYRGQWVALRNGELLGAGERLKDLAARFGIVPEVLYTRVT